LGLLSVLLALKKWRPLLLGTTIVVRIYTDHSANASLHTLHFLNCGSAI
jgi:hypothetical protein